MWTRDENDYLHPDSEISPDLDDDLDGIPVMLKVPSHIEVAIKQTLYVHRGKADQSDKLVTVKLNRPDLLVDAQLKYTEKMFLVDPVKVGAGSGAYGFAFSGDSGANVKNANNGSGVGHGYLQSADYQAVDTTITTSATLLNSILSFAPSSAKQSGFVTDDPAFGLTTIERVVAFRRFDLGSPTVDEEVFAFLEEHMNCCHACGNCNVALSSGEQATPAIMESPGLMSASHWDTDEAPTPGQQ
ncbi:hypothetical protein [Symmachiella dynata]|nr:hypothetical protein [Symmachiella dynata]